MADFLIVGYVELYSSATVLRVYQERDVVGGGAASKRGPVVFRGLLRIEHFEELGRRLGDFAIFGPIRELDALGFGETLAELDGLCPLVGLFDYAEARCRQRVADGPQLNFDQEKAKTAVSVLIEPFNSLTMFIAGMRHHLHDNLGTLACGVGYHLSQMIMIGVLELVFDNRPTPGSNFLCIDIHIERAYG